MFAELLVQTLFRVRAYIAADRVEDVQTIVEEEAQKEFMRYAFLEKPKTSLGKLVSEAWRGFKKWWDVHKRKAVEERTRESVLGKLSGYKTKVEEDKRTKTLPNKHRDGAR